MAVESLPRPARGLPDGWHMVTFGEMAQSITDRVDNPAESGVERYVGLEHLDPETLHIHRWGLPTDVEATKLRFQPGDIIFGRRRAYQRKLAVADFEGICSAHALVLRARQETVEPDFLPVFMQSEVFFKRALEISVGSLSPTINWKTLAVQRFPLPPKPEQRRIAEILWAADTDLGAADRVLVSLNTLKDVVLTEWFGGAGGGASLIAQGRLPSEWVLKPLVQVCEFLDNLRVPLNVRERASRKGPYPYYGASGIVDWIDAYLFDEDLILLSEDGANIVDRSSPVAFTISGKTWVNNHAHVLRPRLSTDLLYVTEYLESISLLPYKTGTAQPKLNKGAAEGIVVPLAPPEVRDQMSKALAEMNLNVARWHSRRERLKLCRSSLANSMLNV